jgi:hypothetical protein
MSPNRPPGLGAQTSTRPTREERRREVERVRPDIDQPATTTSAAAPTTLEPRKKASKVPFNTYVHRSTQQRIEWFKTHGGYSVTDIVEVALNQFLDQQGAPKFSETGELLR